jgi:hypothetical protein
MATNHESMTNVSEQPVTFKWILEKGTPINEARQRAENLQSHGGQADVQDINGNPINPSSGFADPLSAGIVIVGAVVGTFLVQQVLEWWAEYTARADPNKRGVSFHCKPDGEIDIRPLDIPYGQVLVTGCDQRERIVTDPSRDMMQQILEYITKLIPSLGTSEGTA